VSRGLFLPFVATQDPKLTEVPPAARYLFIAIIALAVETNSGGRITRKQAAWCGAGILHLKRHLDQLCAAELLRYDEALDEYIVVDPRKWCIPGRNWSVGRDLTPTQPRPKRGSTVTEKRPNSDLTPTQLRPDLDLTPTQLRPDLPKSNGVSAGQNGHSPEPPRARTQPPPRPRAGAFEVPSSSRTDGTPKVGRDAPRSGGGAARPARKTNPEPAPEMPPEGVTLPGVEARALMRAELKRGRANNPAATGIDTKFSKYDPDRPIEPITSAMVWKVDPE